MNFHSFEQKLILANYRMKCLQSKKMKTGKKKKSLVSQPLLNSEYYSIKPNRAFSPKAIGWMQASAVLFSFISLCVSVDNVVRVSCMLPVKRYCSICEVTTLRIGALPVITQQWKAPLQLMRLISVCNQPQHLHLLLRQNQKRNSPIPWKSSCQLRSKTGKFHSYA